LHIIFTISFLIYIKKIEGRKIKKELKKGRISNSLKKSEKKMTFTIKELNLLLAIIYGNYEDAEEALKDGADVNVIVDFENMEKHTKCLFKYQKETIKQIISQLISCTDTMPIIYVAVAFRSFKRNFVHDNLFDFNEYEIEIDRCFIRAYPTGNTTDVRYRILELLINNGVNRDCKWNFFNDGYLFSYVINHLNIWNCQDVAYLLIEKNFNTSDVEDLFKIYIDGEDYDFDLLKLLIKAGL
jgi:hypothetical protein